MAFIVKLLLAVVGVLALSTTKKTAITAVATSGAYLELDWPD